MLCCVVVSSPGDTESGNDVTLNPGNVRTSEWVIANVGTTPWPADMCACLFFNTPGLEGLPSTISIPSAEPGMTVHVCVEARMPESTGQYEAMWKVGSPELQSFPTVLAVNFGVEDEDRNLDVTEKAEVWQVNLGHFKGWKHLQEPFVTAVRKAMGKHVVEVKAFNKEQQRHWHYELDLQRFQQRNLDNGTVRGLRRWPPPVGARTEAEAFDGLSMPMPNGARPEVFKLSTLWLPCLLQERSKTVVIEARSVAAALRVQLPGVADCGGGVGIQSTFIARFTGKLNNNPVVTLQSAKEGMGFLCASKRSRTVLATCEPDVEDAAHHFEVVPVRSSFSAARNLRSVGFPMHGSALRVVDTDQYVDVVKGELVLRDGVPEGEDEQPAELFVFRYQPIYDVSWREDRQYEGKRRWILGNDPEFYSFPQFVSFVQDTGFTFRPYGESGLIAAKMLWATSVTERFTNEEFHATTRFASSLSGKRPWSKSNPVLYTFSELLAFIEARGLCTPGKGSIESARAKWLSCRGSVS